MIVGFRHKSLKAFYEGGSTKGIDATYRDKLARILAALDSAAAPTELNLPSFKLHPLKGERQGE